MILPDFVIGQFAPGDKYVILNYVARFFGAAMLLAAWFLWMLKDMANAKLQRTIAIVFLGYSVVGFAAIIMGMTAIGVIRTNGWVLLFFLVKRRVALFADETHRFVERISELFLPVHASVFSVVFLPEILLHKIRQNASFDQCSFWLL